MRLLGEFAVERGDDRVDLPHSARRLVAFLAVSRRPVARAVVSGSLWPEGTDERAAGNLRSALWRLRQAGADITVSSPLMIALAPEVTTDLDDVVRDAWACLDGHEVPDDLDRRLCGDLLPDWYDEWLVIERERLRQLRLHALEALCTHCTRSGALARAVDLGLAAVALEPLRESAHRVLISAHLAEGNVAEALRQYDSFRRIAAVELGVAPTSALAALIAAARDTPVTPRHTSE